MKYRFKILIAVLFAACSSLSAKTLNIKISDIDINRGGAIVVMIFTGDGFPTQHKQANYIQAKSALQSTLNFQFDVDVKELAIKVLHDENSDNKVNKNWTGIYPREGLGFSNNQTLGITGPPNYQDSKLSANQLENDININLIYP
ncbi:DUF2141 domain-containing protein [Catenovulum sediminis]|uniref:DUF2141 domain-containing protein n=1 Tax=Catenovulum sediminis TaxID=1740262 RepID=A0ABV1RJ66_9ALTE